MPKSGFPRRVVPGGQGELSPQTFGRPIMASPLRFIPWVVILLAIALRVLAAFRWEWHIDELFTWAVTAGPWAWTLIDLNYNPPGYYAVVKATAALVPSWLPDRIIPRLPSLTLSSLGLVLFYISASSALRGAASRVALAVTVGLTPVFFWAGVLGRAYSVVFLGAAAAVVVARQATLGRWRRALSVYALLGASTLLMHYLLAAVWIAGVGATLLSIFSTQASTRRTRLWAQVGAVAWGLSPLLGWYAKPPASRTQPLQVPARISRFWLSPIGFAAGKAPVTFAADLLRIPRKLVDWNRLCDGWPSKLATTACLLLALLVLIAGWTDRALATERRLWLWVSAAQVAALVAVGLTRPLLMLPSLTIGSIGIANAAETRARVGVWMYLGASTSALMAFVFLLPFSDWSALAGATSEVRDGGAHVVVVVGRWSDACIAAKYFRETCVVVSERRVVTLQRCRDAVVGGVLLVVVPAKRRLPFRGNGWGKVALWCPEHRWQHEAKRAYGFVLFRTRCRDLRVWREASLLGSIGRARSRFYHAATRKPSEEGEGSPD